VTPQENGQSGRNLRGNKTEKVRGSEESRGMNQGRGKESGDRGGVRIKRSGNLGGRRLSRDLKIVQFNEAPVRWTGRGPINLCRRSLS